MIGHAQCKPHRLWPTSCGLRAPAVLCRFILCFAQFAWSCFHPLTGQTVQS
jgi:hypothetical protein